MSDSTSGPLNPVDQGTVFMLSVSFGALAIALVYFACKWYRKRKQKSVDAKPVPTSAGNKSKSNVMRSFSRFSQVDEELTFYNTDETDFDLPETLGQVADGIRALPASPKRHQHIKRNRAATQGNKKMSPKMSPSQKSKEYRKSAPPSERKYLETSM